MAWTRSESFEMTAFQQLPPWSDFLKGRDSAMLRNRSAFIDDLCRMHRETMKRYTSMKTDKDEDLAYSSWKAKRPKA